MKLKLLLLSLATLALSVSAQAQSVPCNPTNNVPLVAGLTNPTYNDSTDRSRFRGQFHLLDNSTSGYPKHGDA
jgi:hypothetical protein